MNTARQRTLEESITNLVNTILGGVHTAIPATVKSYNDKKLLVDVQPSINSRFEDGTVLAQPTIYSVPVVFPRTKTAAITFPIEKGDSVLLVFSEKSLDEWIDKGKGTPEDPRRFDLSDAFAIPGVFKIGDGKQPKNKDCLEIQYKHQSVSIDKQGNVEVGNEESKPLARVIVNGMSVELGGETIDPTDGVVTGKCACMAYGMPHSIVSPIVKAKFTP